MGSSVQGYMVLWVHGCADSWGCEGMGVQVHGCAGVWEYGCMGVRGHGCVRAWV